MNTIIEVTDLSIRDLEIFSMYSEAQLRNVQSPENAIFLAESPKVIEAALDAGCEPVALLLERKLIDGQAKDIIFQCDGIPIYTADESVLTQITGYHLTKGAMCAMKRPPMETMDNICRNAHRIVIIDSITNVTNEGAIFRSAAALGMDAVLLTPTCCNPLNRRTVRVSMGTVFQIPWAYVDINPACWPSIGIDKLHHLGFKTVAMALSNHAININDPKLSAIDKLAVIMGTEGDGLSMETIEACDYVARIPMFHGVDSLNVAAASAVAFWQLQKPEI